MDKLLCFRSLATLALSLMLAGAAFAQNAPEKKKLVVNGRTADSAVVQIDGHSYVDVDSFARIMNAAVSFEPGRVILTIPAAEAGAKPERTAAPGLSKEFAKASISQLAVMWEWKGAIASAVRSGVAGGNWLGPWLVPTLVQIFSGKGNSGIAALSKSRSPSLINLRHHRQLGRLEKTAPIKSGANRMDKKEQTGYQTG